MTWMIEGYDSVTDELVAEQDLISFDDDDARAVLGMAAPSVLDGAFLLASEMWARLLARHPALPASAGPSSKHLWFLIERV